MRIAYLPVISARNVSAAPSYNWFRAVHRIALERDPNTVFYVLVPRVDEDNHWQSGAEWDLPRVHVIPVTMYESQFDELGLVTREVYELFNERFGTAYFDVILSEKPSLAPIIKKLASFHIRGKSRNPLVVNRDQFTVDTEWFKVTQTDELLQAVGWADAPTVFQSDHQAKRALQIARKHVTGAHLRRINEQMRVFPLGIDCADVDALNMAERGQKLDKLTVNYSHKLFVEQKFIESLAIMDSVFAGGRQIDLQVVTGSSESKLKMVKAARPYAWMTCYGGMNRTAFLRQMARAHVFISNSIYEDFSATVVEQLWTGLVPVLIDKPWSRYLLPADYPFLFRTPEEGRAMLCYVLDHYEQVVDEWVWRIKEKVAAEFDLAAIIPMMLDWMGELNTKRVAEMKAPTDGLRKLVEAAFQACPDEFGEPEFYEAIKANSEGLDVNRDVESRSTSRWMCVDVMLAAHPELVDLGGRRVRWRKSL